mgnify:FL=1
MDCWGKFKDGPHGAEIEGGIGALRGFFEASLCFPQVGFLVLLEEDEVKGFAIITETQSTSPSADGTTIRLVTHGFVRAIHIQHGVPLRYSLAMERAICLLGQERRYPFLTGHCSGGYLSRAEKPYSRWGWHKTHTVVMKTP